MHHFLHPLAKPPSFVKNVDPSDLPLHYAAEALPPNPLLHNSLYRRVYYERETRSTHSLLLLSCCRFSSTAAVVAQLLLQADKNGEMKAFFKGLQFLDNNEPLLLMRRRPFPPSFSNLRFTHPWRRLSNREEGSAGNQAVTALRGSCRRIEGVQSSDRSLKKRKEGHVEIIELKALFMTARCCCLWLANSHRQTAFLITWKNY